MNFKDAYKSYNDDIKGNREILTSILSGEPKKKKHFNYRPVFAGAVLAVIAVSVFGFFGGNNDRPQAPSLYIASNDERQISDSEVTPLPDEKSQGEGASQTPSGESQTQMSGGGNITADEAKKGNPEANTDSKDTSASAGIGAGENNDSGVSDGKSLSEDVNSAGLNQSASAAKGSNAGNEAVSQKKIAGEDAITESPASGNAPDSIATVSDDSGAQTEVYTPRESPDMGYSVDEPYNFNEILPDAADTAYAGGGGGGGSASSGGSSASTPAPPAASGGSAAGAKSSVSSESYYEYIGINFGKKALLPVDMSFSGAPDITFEKSGGKVINDSVLLHAVSKSNPTRSISIYASKSNAFATNTNEIIEGDDTSNNATVCINGVSVSIDSSGVSISEVRKLIESLR